MLEFGPAEVRLKLNTDDFDKSVKQIQSDDRCIEICADLNVDGLNKKLKGLQGGLDCLDLCVEIDRDKIQKSLADIQKGFNLQIQAELDVSTQQAERSLKAIEDKAGNINSTLILQTADAQRQLSEFRGQLESVALLTSSLSADLNAEIKVNTSNFDNALNNFTSKFSEAGDDLADKHSAKPLSMALNELFALFKEASEAGKKISLDPIQKERLIDPLLKELNTTRDDLESKINFGVDAFEVNVPDRVIFQTKYLDEFIEFNRNLVDSGKKAIDLFKARRIVSDGNVSFVEDTAVQLPQIRTQEKARLKKPKTEKSKATEISEKPPEIDQLSKARKAASQELQILTGQLRNAREQNISTLAFDVVNSLKNLNVQIFKTEQALQGLQAPGFDTPEIPQFNEAVLGASELISKIRGEFDSLFMGVADLNQRIRNQRLPDLLGDVSTPSAAGVDEGFNKVIQSVFSFGKQIEEADSSLGVQFLDIRDTFIRLGQSIGSNDFTENLNKASLSLFEFSKDADIADPRLLDSFADVGAELQKFERRLESTAPEQSSNGSGVAESLRMVSEEASKAAISLKTASEKANLFEPPDLGKFIEAPFKTLREEVSRSAQLFGLATAETTAFGGAAKLAKEGLDQIAKVSKENLSIDTSEVKSELSELASGLKKVRQESFEVALRFDKTFKSQNFSKLAGEFSNDIASSLEQIKKTASSLAIDLIVIEGLQSDLNKLVPNVLKAVEGTVNAARLNAAIFERVGPTIAGINEDLSSFNNNVGRNLGGLADELPRAVGSFEGLVETVSLIAQAADVLREKVDLIQTPAALETALEPLFNKLIAKIDEINISDGSPNRVASDLEPVMAFAGIDSSDPQVPGSPDQGSPDIAKKISSGNDKLDQIRDNVQRIREERVIKQEAERAEKVRQARGGELQALFDDRLKALDNSSAKTLANVINENLLRKDFSKSENFKDLREVVAPVDKAVIDKSLEPGASKKAISKANKLIRRILIAALEDPGLASKAEDALRKTLNGINVAIDKVGAGEVPAFKDVPDFISNRFSGPVAKALNETLDGQQIDIQQFIGGDEAKALAKEYSVAVETILKEVRQLVATQEIFDQGNEAIKDQISFLEQLQGVARGAFIVLDKIADGPALSKQDKKSLQGSKTRFDQLQPQISNELLPSLKISAGILPSTSELESLLKVIQSDSFKDALEIGDEITEGIKVGIERGLPKIEGSGDELGNRLLQDIRDSLGIASPAKRVIELMRFVIQGVQVGLERGKGVVQGAFNKLVDFGEVKGSIDVGDQVNVEPPKRVGFKGFSQDANKLENEIRQQLNSPQVLNAAEAAGKKIGEVAGQGVNAGVTVVESGVKAVGAVAPAARSGIGGFFSGLNGQIRDLQQRFPVLQNFKEILRDVAFGVGSLIGVFSIGDLFVEGFRNGINAAKLFESQVKSLSISLGGTVKALKELQRVEFFSGDISSNLLSARENFKQLAAVTRGTRLEGEQTQEIFEGLATATTALQLPTEQADRAFTAVGQVISKNRFQAEELRGQLAEALPGAIGILARSLGVSVTELDKLVTSGKVGADVLVNFSKQLKLEFGAGVRDAAESLQGAENRLKNAATLLQEQFGRSALPIATAALNVFSGALTFAGENAGTIGALLLSTIGVSLFNLNTRFGLISKATGLFSKLLGDDLKLQLKATKADLASAGGGLKGFGQRLKIVGTQAKSALGPLVKFGAQALLVTAVISGIQSAFDSFKANPLVEELRKAREESQQLTDELNKNPLTRRDRAGDASNSAVGNILNPGKFLEEARRANAIRTGQDQDLFGSGFILERTAQQSDRRSITNEFASDANLKEIRDSLKQARELRDEALKTGKTIEQDDQEQILRRLGNQISFLQNLKASDFKLFEELGGPKFLASFENTRKSILDLSAAGAGFRDKLRDIGKELENIELSKLEADVGLQENIADQFKGGNFDSKELELDAAKGLNQALEMQVIKQKELLDIERAKLQDAELIRRLNDPVQQSAALEEQKKIQEDIDRVEKDLLGSRKELASQTVDLLQKERERRLNAIDTLALEKELGLAKERASRVGGAQETPFTADLDELANLDAIDKARSRLFEFSSNGSEEEILNAEKALTDAIANEENRRLEVRKKNQQNKLEFTKLLLSNESAEIAKALNSREITQVQADKQLSNLRQRELGNSISELERQRDRLLADFGNAPNSEGNSAQVQEQLNTINNSLIEENKALFEEQTNFRISEEDRFLEKAQKASDTLLAIDKAKSDALIRNIERVNGESDSLIRTLDRQEKKLQSQFDLVNAQQGRAGQGFDIALNRNSDASSALGLLTQEKGIREQISDLRLQSLSATDEEREGLKEQSKELESQLLSTSQRIELSRQLQETTGSSLISERDLLKSRIKLEENSTRQRAEALAAELQQERALLQISIQRDQLAAKAATRQAQLGLIQSQVQRTEQQQGVLGIQREINIAQGRGDTDQVSLLEAQLQVAREGLQLTQQQIGLSGGVLRDSQLAEIDLSSLSERALDVLDISQASRAESFLADEESSRRQFNLSTIQSGGEDFIGGRGIKDSRERLLRAGVDLESSNKSPSVVSSEARVNQIVGAVSNNGKMQDAAIKSLDNTVRVVGELVVDAINRNAIKLPKRREQPGSRRRPSGEDSSDLRSFGL